MLKKTTTIILLAFFSCTAFAFMSVEGNNNTTVIQVYPSTIEVPEAGRTFSVNITIANVTCLCAWEIKLYYRSSILMCINATEGPFLQAGGETMWAENITNAYNSTHGRVCIGSTLLGQVPGVNGSGVLATIIFQTKGGGSTTLHFGATKLYDCSMPPQPIEHETVDGEVFVGAHDVAVVNVTPWKTIVGQSYICKINVTITNEGNFTETFNVTVYANTATVNQTELTLTNCASATITLTWDTTDFAKGNYTIWAYAWPVPRETDTADNTFTDGIVIVGIPGDINEDRVVDSTDLGMLGTSWCKFSGDPFYNPNADINFDGVVDSTDLGIMGSHWGETL